MKIAKAIEISDAKIHFVSLVDKAANQRQFLITKDTGAGAEEGQANFSTVGKILKVDDNTHYVTGIVYEPLVEDSHGNYMTEEEIRKAAYWFAENGDKVDIQHSFEKAAGVTVVESYVALCDIFVRFHSDGRIGLRNDYVPGNALQQLLWANAVQAWVTGNQNGDSEGTTTTDDLRFTRVSGSSAPIVNPSTGDSFFSGTLLYFTSET